MMEFDPLKAAELVARSLSNNAIDQRTAESYRAAISRGDKGQAARDLYTLRLRRRLRNQAEFARFCVWLGTPENQADPESCLAYLDRFPEPV